VIIEGRIYWREVFIALAWVMDVVLGKPVEPDE
jgi:hypothetical protein